MNTNILTQTFPVDNFSKILCLEESKPFFLLRFRFGNELPLQLSQKLCFIEKIIEKLHKYYYYEWKKVRFQNLFSVHWNAPSKLSFSS